MGRYAEGTSVEAGLTVAQLRTLLLRKGAKNVITHETIEPLPGVMIVFELWDGEQVYPVRIGVFAPDGGDPEYSQTPTGRERSAEAVRDAVEKEYRRRWRAVLALLRAKFLAIEEGVSSVMNEFMGSIVLKDGRTVVEAVAPHVHRALEGGVGLRLPAGLGGRE